MQQHPVVIATPVVATAVSPVASPVDSASVYRPMHLDRRSSRPILPSCDVHVTFAKTPCGRMRYENVQATTSNATASTTASSGDRATDHTIRYDTWVGYNSTWKYFKVLARAPCTHALVHSCTHACTLLASRCRCGRIRHAARTYASSVLNCALIRLSSIHARGSLATPSTQPLS